MGTPLDTEARMFVKGFFCDGLWGALNQPGGCSGFVSGVAWVDTTGKSHPVLWEARSLQVTPWPSPVMSGVGVGRSLVAQPEGV